MTEREFQLLNLIRTGKDPAALFLVAMENITACLKQPAPSEAPCPAAPASGGGTDQ